MKSRLEKKQNTSRGVTSLSNSNLPRVVEWIVRFSARYTIRQFHSDGERISRRPFLPRVTSRRKGTRGRLVEK